MSDCDPFAKIYDEWSDHMREDVAFYVELAREAEGPIVELRAALGAQCQSPCQVSPVSPVSPISPPGWGTACRRFERIEKNWTRL